MLTLFMSYKTNEVAVKNIQISGLKEVKNYFIFRNRLRNTQYTFLI